MYAFVFGTMYLLKIKLYRQLILFHEASIIISISLNKHEFYVYVSVDAAMAKG